MPNGSAGAGKRADYSGLADRQTRRRPGPSPSRWPRLIPSRIAPEILLRDSGLVRGNAHMPYRGL